MSDKRTTRRSAQPRNGRVAFYLALPASTRDAVRKRAAAEGSTLTAALTQAMRDYVDLGTRVTAASDRVSTTLSVDAATYAAFKAALAERGETGLDVVDVMLRRSLA